MISTPTQADIKPVEETTPWLQRPLIAQLPFVTPELLIVIAIMILAVFSRFYILGDRVMSHDETNHVNPQTGAYGLYIGNGYVHDPVTHGPFQFHILALTYFLFGASDFTSRAPAALFSIATVFFAWWGFRRYLGRIGALVAAFMMLISPYILFYGRYTRNEAFVGLSFVIMVYAMLRYFDTGRTRYLYVFTLAFCLHFISKETSFIYAAQALIFLAGYLFYQLIRKPWKNPADRRTFLLGLAAGVVLFGLALVAYEATKPAVPVATPTVSTAPAASEPAQTAPAPLPWMALGLGALGAIDLAVAIYFLVRGVGLASIRRERSFDLLILLGTLVLPQLSPFPVKLLGWDPLDYSMTGAIHTMIFVLILTAMAIAIGLWWKPRVWAVCMGMFYAIFFTFFTTFFTNGQGFLTGLVGALGYWLSQQGVQRGEQPLYYYALIQIPMYEFLPAVGTILAFVLALRKPGLATLPVAEEAASEDPQPADAEFGVENPLPAEAVVTADGAGETEPGEQPVAAPVQAPQNRVPVVPLLLFWAVTSLAAYSVAGERMPWLTVHITLPMIMVSGWAFGYLIATTPWKRLAQNRLGLTLVLLPVFFFSLLSLFSHLGGTNPPFQGKELPQLQATLTFLSALIGALASLSGILWLTRRWSGYELARGFGMVIIVLLAAQTIRAAVRSSYINYDTAREYLVYAHAARGPKDVLADVEDISRRTVGGLDIAVAYDNDTLYPFWWYFRDFPNKVYYADKPTRDLRNDPVVLVGQDNYDQVASILGNNYVYYQTMRLWWPNQDYFNLTWDRVRGALTNPAIRAGIWQIWLNADYTQYANATGNKTLTLTTWDPSNSMRIYIRKDIVSQIWKYGAAPAPVQEDPYAKGTVQLSADKVIGQAGSEPGQFQYPHGIAVAPDGSLYVADSRNQRIQHLSADGQVMQTWGSFGDASKGNAPGGTFNEPWGIAVAKDGSVFVADTWNNRIQKFTSDGKFVKMWGYFGQAEKPEAFWGPRGLAITPDNHLLVTDTGNKRVVIFDLDGNPIGSFGENGSDQGQLNEPVGIAVDSSGKVFVADTWNQRIQAFAPSTDGKSYTFQSQWDINAWFGQSLDNKPFLAVDQSGNVFATDPEGNRVLEFDNSGKFIRAWGDAGSDEKSFNLAAAVAVDAQGNVWVTDANNGRVMRFTMPK